jgi:hypothetical protein
MKFEGEEEDKSESKSSPLFEFFEFLEALFKLLSKFFSFPLLMFFLMMMNARWRRS